MIMLDGVQLSLVFGNDSGEQGDTKQQLSEDLMQVVLQRLATLQTVDANMRLKVALFGNEYRGSGIYLEKRDQDDETSSNDQLLRRLFLLELKFQSNSAAQPGNDSNTLKIVCDGVYVWKYSSTEGLYRVEINQLLEAIAQSDRKTEFENPGDMGKMPGLGGLEGTLRSMKGMYAFSRGTVESTQLGSQAFGVWKITAPMKEDILKRMMQSLGVKEATPQTVQVQIPTAVALYVGKDDFFPYRIDYFQGPYDEIDWNRPYIQQELFNVALNSGGISNSRFQYTSGESIILEEKGTEKYIQKLGL
ncbi:MAG: hypothetical protein ACRC10_03970 [Thermoguttaceae bacterium]